MRAIQSPGQKTVPQPRRKFSVINLRIRRARLSPLTLALQPFPYRDTSPGQQPSGDIYG